MPDINAERMDRQSSNSTLLQLTDTFFPSGTFTLSHGLEALYKTGQLENSQDLADLIRYQLRYKVCPTDLVVLGVCYQASAENDMERVYQVDSYLWAHTLIESARNTQRKSGRALLTVAKEIWPDPKLESMAIAAQKQTFHCLNSVVLGVVSQVAGLSPWHAKLGYTHSFVTGIVSAAIRLGVCGHIQGQKIIATLASDIEQVCKESTQEDLDSLWTGVPILDIAQMTHANLPHHQFAN